MEDDIAVIGIGLRFPGEAESPQGLWEVLERGQSQWSEFPKDRLNIDGYFHPGGDRQGSISFRGAHFLKKDVSAFDAPFFSVSVDDARAIDPQQRILLEVSYEALESAGIRKEDVEGSDTSVYVGSFVKDYEQICLRDPDWQPQYAATGNGIAIMANRISYAFNFHGPSMTIDTGCSGSLVAIHLASKSLQNRECSLALAAGAGLILTPNTIMPMTALNFLSPDGKCFTFDSRANGYGRGEGVGVVVLKRLSDALRDNDTIRAVIRGTRVNQDGRTPGITLPSKEAQVDNIRSLYTSVGLSFDQTAYVECHGTGTQAGDWRELKAVSETLAESRSVDQPIIVGSLKPNIGHLEGAAGVAGLIKGVLVLEHGKIPPNINFQHGNPTIDFQEWKVKVPTKLMDWPLPGVRRVSVNCFGFGGTNAHVILEESHGYLESHGLNGNHDSTSLDHGNQVHSLKCRTKPRIFCFSSNEKAGVRRIIESHLEYLQDNKRRLSSEFLASYSYTLCCRRSNLEWKHFLIADSADELLEKMTSSEMPSLKRSAIEKQPRICFAFCGQGSQWANIEGLLQYPSFEASLKDASKYLDKALGSSFDLLEEILAPEKSKGRPEVAQPATTAIQIAMVDLLQSWSVEARHVIGHSSGEIAAAYAGGALTREAAWEVAYFRGMAAARISQSQGDTKGAMLATGMSFDEAQAYLSSSECDIDIACINSPRSVTLSGEANSMYRVANELKERGIFYRQLSVDVAYHSRQMKSVEEYYQRLLEHIATKSFRPNVTMFSSVHGNKLQGSQLDATYWANNMVSPVQFQLALQQIMSLSSEERPTIIVELSPQMSLKSPILDTLSDLTLKSPPTYFSIADKKLEFTRSVPQVAAELWSLGHKINLSPITRGGLPTPPRCLSDLPRYPWNHSNSYWHESHLGEANRFREYPRQDLIGAPTADSTPFEPRWRGFLRVSENPWIQDHQVQKTIIYPAAGMISMVLEGAKQIENGDQNLLGYEISQMEIEKAMVIPTTKHGLEMALNIKMNQSPCGNGGQHSFSIYSKQLGSSWERNAAGFIRYCYGLKSSEATQRIVDNLESLGANCTNLVVPRQLYEHMDTLGMNYGPMFQNIVEIRQGNGCCFSQVRIPDTKSKMPAAFEYPHLLHPATLDSMFQTLFAIEPTPMVPTFIESIFVSADVDCGNSCNFVGFSTASRVGIGSAKADIAMLLKNSDSLIKIQGLQLTALESSMKGLGSSAFLPNHHNLCTGIVWEKDAAFSTPNYLSGFLALWAHKHPGLSILQIGGPSSLTKAILDTLSPTGCEAPRLSRYTIGRMEDDQQDILDLETLQDKRVAPFIEFVKTDGSENLPDYHLILVVNENSPDLGSLGSHLKGDGRILHISILKHTEPVDRTISGMQDPEKDMLELHKLEVHIIQQPPVTEGSLAHPIVLLYDQQNEQISKFITNFSTKSRLDISRVSLSASIADPSILTDKIVISLLDLTRNDTRDGFAYSWSESEFDMFHSIQQKAKGILWIMQGAHMRPINPKASPMVALARTLMSEDPLKTIITLDLATGTKLGHDKICGLVLNVLLRSFGQGTSAPRETEYAEESGQLYIPRLVPLSNLNKIIEKSENDALISKVPFHHKPSAPGPNLKLAISRPGLTDGSAYFVRCPDQHLKANEVKVMFNKAIVSYLDLEIAKGRRTEASICMDMIGRIISAGCQVRNVNQGDKVVILAAEGALQNILYGDSRFMEDYRPGLIPSCFVSAYHGLVDVGRLSAGRTVLVHAGASCFGLAAVQICRIIGAEVFVTVMGNDINSQRSALERGGMNPDHIVEANSDEFVVSIMEKTGGRGVDVLYNPTHEHTNNNVRCVRRGGCLVQFDQGDRCIAREVPVRGTFATFDLGQMIRDDIDDAAKLFQLTMDFLRDKPLDFMTSAITSTEFEISRPMEALRYLEQAPYLGYATILGSYSPSQRVPVLSEDISSRFKNSIDHDGTYLLAGGLGGLGRSICELLVANGAQSLTFLSRSGASTDEARKFIDQLTQRGVQTRIYQVDICDRSALAPIIQAITAEGARPLRGVFQCAAVIKDAVFDNMSYSDWMAAFRPKAEGSWNLVEAVVASKQDPFFIFLASSAGVIGNRGQANYAAGNCFEDALARHLRIRGKHAVSIDLGPVLGAGMLAEDEAILDALRASGFYGIRHEDFLQILEHAITMEILPGQRMPAQVVLGVGTGGLTLQNQPADPYWSRTALYNYLNLVDMPPPDLSDGNAGSVVDVKTRLASCVSIDEAAEIACTGLTNMLAKAMNMHIEEMDTGKPPNSYGVDSLVAVGVRNWILSNCGVQVSVFEILSEKTIAELAVLVAEKGGFGDHDESTQEEAS